MPSGSVTDSVVDADVKRDREAHVDRPHVRPLVEFVEQKRGDLGLDRWVPMPDSADGGVNARLLLLLDAPGPKAVRTGFITMDNQDPTARNLRPFAREAGVPRSAVICWNAVPWFIGDASGKRICAVKTEDLEEGWDCLRLFLRQLRRLRAVVGLGRAAQRAWKVLAWPRHVPRIETYHPSNQALNPDPARRLAVQNALGGAASYVYDSGASWPCALQ